MSCFWIGVWICCFFLIVFVFVLKLGFWCDLLSGKLLKFRKIVNRNVLKK